MAKKVAKKTKTPQPNGRNPKGRFIKGNKAGEGKTTPSAIHKQKLTEVFNATISEQDIIAIAKKLASKARAGNIDSAKLVLDRCLGRPKETEEGGGSNIPTSAPRIPVDEIMSHYFLTLQKLPPLGGIDIRSIEGNTNGRSGSNNRS